MEALRERGYKIRSRVTDKGEAAVKVPCWYSTPQEMERRSKKAGERSNRPKEPGGNQCVSGSATVTLADK